MTESWLPLVAHAEGLVEVDRKRAFGWLLDQRAYHPVLLRSAVTRAAGEPGMVGELLEIDAVDENGDPAMTYQSQTVSVVPGERVVWFNSAPTNDHTRSFVDCALRDTNGGVVMSVAFLATTRNHDSLAHFQQWADDFVISHIETFRRYCLAMAGGL
jgi:hypothetical protein